MVLVVLGCGSSGKNVDTDAPNPNPDAAIDAEIDAGPDPIIQGVMTYVKASNTGNGDELGTGVAISGDGQTIAIGAPREDSAATGIDGDALDNTKTDSGAVYIYVRSGATWALQAYVKASNSDANDQFGSEISLSANGNTLAVVAGNEASCSPGVNATQTDNGCFGAGAVYIFVRSGTTWSQQAYVKASNPRPNIAFGRSAALSGDGNTLAVGQPGDPSTATGIDGSHTNIAGSNNGSVHVFTRAGTTWSQQAYVKSAASDQQDTFGASVSLSANGDVLAVGASGESSAATGVNGSQVDNSLRESGAAYVFKRTGGAWSQHAFVKASNPDMFDYFGSAVALSASGTTLAVGAEQEDSGATTIDGDQNDDSQLSAGAVYVFTLVGTQGQQAYLKGTYARNLDTLGRSVALSANGNLLVAGSAHDTATPASGDTSQSGAAYVFRRTGTTWTKQNYLKATSQGNADIFGGDVAISSDGSVLLVGTHQEDGSSLGIGGNPADNGAENSGAAYLVE